MKIYLKFSTTVLFLILILTSVWAGSANSASSAKLADASTSENVSAQNSAQNFSEGDTDANEEKSFLDKEFDSAPSATESSILTDEGWLEQEETARDQERNKKMQQRLIMTVFALFIVITLIFITLKFLSSGKINIPSLGLGTKSSNIKITDKATLQPGKAVYILKIGSKTIAVGVSENNIQYLTDVILPDSNVDDRNEQISKKNIENSSFSLFPKIEPYDGSKVKQQENGASSED